MFVQIDATSMWLLLRLHKPHYKVEEKFQTQISVYYAKIVQMTNSLQFLNDILSVWYLMYFPKNFNVDITYRDCLIKSMQIQFIE